MNHPLPGPAAAVKLLRKLGNRRPSRALRAEQKPLALYGAGNLGTLAKGLLERVGRKFAFVVDSDPAKAGANPAWKGVKLVRPAEVAPRDRRSHRLAVCVVTDSFARISAQLRAQGWKDIVHFYDVAEYYKAKYPLGNGWYAGPLTPRDIEETSRVLSGWGDDASRAHHLAFIAWHALREELAFDGAEIIVGNRFFIPEVVAALGDRAVYLDCGAYHGDVIARFIDETGGRFKGIAAVEPDRESLALLRAAVKRFPAGVRSRIKVVEAAVGAKAGRSKFFHGLGYASRFHARGNGDALVRRIDDLKVPATFIKLHLEGAELPAIKGALETISSYRPVIAATVYHNRDGMWKTPGYLMRSLSGYRFLLRLHNWAGTGCVVYCIPLEMPAQGTL